MLFVSGSNGSHHKLNITHDVFEFFTQRYTIKSNVEIHYTDLSHDFALGFTEKNGDEHFVQVHHDLIESEMIRTIFHELTHVIQNEQGIYFDKLREDQAYHMENVLYDWWCDSR